ncbi:MAG: 16S rRNA (uracil(1498)-N(3))-methyltransferase [Candidatus Obscuribacterales bacterium]|nr:16S rRNA (uracil(1498)-N(3))-methyltransferase [Candidatus Obscuribacterales bacterium]
MRKVKMTTHRFLIPEQLIDLEGGSVRISDKTQIKQITRVLRLEENDLIEAQDENGTVYQVNLTRIGREEIEGRIVSSTKARAKIFRLTIMVALLKGGNFEYTLSKLTELGVDRIIPIVTERTIVRVKDEGADKMRRWLTIVKEATEQCERGRPPQVVNAQPFEKALNDLIKTDKTPNIFICAERSQAPHLVTILYESTPSEASPAVPMSDICIVIGPEGGFTDQEIEHAISLGCIPCGLGDTILRSETAATMAAGLAASFGEYLWHQREYQLDSHNPLQ